MDNWFNFLIKTSAMKFHKIFVKIVNVMLVVMPMLCLGRYALSVVEKLPIFWITLTMTVCIHIFISHSLVTLKIPNPKQSLFWAGMSVYVSSFWIAWQIIEQPGNPEHYIFTILASLFYGFVGVAVCFFFSHIADRLNKTW